MTVQYPLSFDPTATVIDRIIDVARSRPDEPAIVMAGRTLTYGQLDRASSRVAHAITARGVDVGDIVGIVVERSIEMIIAIVAVLKTGAAYAAIDPEYPPERVAQMCAAIQMALILTTENGLGNRPPFGAPRLHLDRDRALIETFPDNFSRPSTTPDDIVYVVFTSGSTGAPKATAVHQAGWTNLMRWFLAEFEIGLQDRCLIISSFSFDITQRAIVMPLLAGGQLHLSPFPAIDVESILAQIRDDGITLMNSAPSSFYPMAESSNSAAAGGLRWLFLGGEPINAARLRTWAEAPTTRARIANVYGTAECSDVSSFHVLADYTRYVVHGVPAGRPISNTRILILGEDSAPVAEGKSGEIVIGGIGVGRGYINDPMTTARKFVADPEVPGATLYRSGDVGRWLPDFGLVFEGRTDHQVKIRGNRVDLGDVETLLRQDIRLRDAVALKSEAGRSETLAAVLLVDALPTDATTFAAEIRKAMARRAPAFMVPSHVEFFTTLPLNPNGKVDRQAIAAGMRPPLVAEDSASALSPMEKDIAQVFCRILGIAHVGRDDNFFDLGGYSVLVTEALAEINSSLDTAITIYDFLSGPSVGALVECVMAASTVA